MQNFFIIFYRHEDGSTRYFRGEARPAVRLPGPDSPHWVRHTNNARLFVRPPVLEGRKCVSSELNAGRLDVNRIETEVKANHLIIPQ